MDVNTSLAVAFVRSGYVALFTNALHTETMSWHMCDVLMHSVPLLLCLVHVCKHLLCMETRVAHMTVTGMS